MSTPADFFDILPFLWYHNYKFYIKITKILFIVGVIAYVYITVKMISDIIKKNYELINMWIIISGILGAMLTLIFGIAYETVLNAPVVTSMYLAAAYPLILMFSLAATIYAIINIIKSIKNKEEKNLKNKEEVTC